MRRFMLAARLAATALIAAASIAAAALTSKEQLTTPPAGARHYVISPTAGKHGDIWSWTMSDGHVAYRMSMNLRGWITETDELVTLGADRRPTVIAIRGYTDQGDATEDFSVDPGDVAHWKTTVDADSAPFGSKRYNAYGGPWLANEGDIKALVAAGDNGVNLLLTGHAAITIGPAVQIRRTLGSENRQTRFHPGV